MVRGFFVAPRTPPPLFDGPPPQQGWGGLTAARHPLARSGKWLSRASGRRTARVPSFTVSRSTSRARSRSPDGSSTRLSWAAPSASLQSASRAKASKPNPGSSAAALSASSRCRCFGSRLAIVVAAQAVATLPSTRKPCRASRRAPRCRSCNWRTSSGISRSSAWPAASTCVAGSSSRSAARGGRSPGVPVSGSGLRPSVRSSASTTS